MPEDWGWLVDNWTACYRATAWNIETGLYQKGKGYSGEACITLNVLEVIYGPPLDKIPIWFTGIDFPGCLTYNQGGRFEQFKEIGLGQELVVFCGQDKKDSCWYSSKWGLFFVGGEAALSLDDKDLKALRKAAEK